MEFYLSAQKNRIWSREIMPKCVNCRMNCKGLHYPDFKSIEDTGKGYCLRCLTKMRYIGADALADYLKKYPFEKDTVITESEEA